MSDWIPLTLDRLTNALKEVFRWDDLAVQLKVSYHRIQEIKEEFQTVEQRKRAALQSWLESNPKGASWESLIAALRLMKQERVALTIETEFHCQPPDDTSLQAPSTTPTEKTEPASKSTRTREIIDNVAKLERKFRRLFCEAQVDFSRKQSQSPEFLPKFRASLAVLPMSLKHSHMKFLEEKSLKITNATTIEELLFILGNYSNYWNHELITEAITTFGNDALLGEHKLYLSDLREFQRTTRLAEFILASTGRMEIPTHFSKVVTQMKADSNTCTLEEIEQFRQELAQRASIDSIAIIFSGGDIGSILLVWGVPSSAVPLVLEAMDEEFLHTHGIESTTIDGIDIHDYPQSPESDNRSQEQQDHGVTSKDATAVVSSHSSPASHSATRVSFNARNCNVLVLGETEAGKSTVWNQIIGEEWFKTLTFNSVTRLSHVQRIIPGPDNIMYDIKVIDCPGSFNNDAYQDVKTYMQNHVPEGVSLVLLVTRRSRFTRELRATFAFIMEDVCGISPISALVVTHCELMAEYEREDLIRKFRTDQHTVDIARFMQKGIYAVGFPDLSRVRPSLRSVYEEDMAADAETLRNLVFRSTDMLPTKLMFFDPKETE